MPERNPKMKTISIDIETFSSVDLAKSGVYRYAESPDFEVLLFGYSVDGGAVSVVDLASGEIIPPHILAALEDETVIKCAFNANFERICLSRLLGYETGHYLSPISWHCTMVWSAYGSAAFAPGVRSSIAVGPAKADRRKRTHPLFLRPLSADQSK